MLAKILENFKNKNNKTNDFKLAKPSDDLIPYVCHVDDYNIITKNGYIFQTIKIDLVTSHIDSDLRSELRKSLYKILIDKPDISLWLHTIRTKKNININSRYNNRFCHDLYNEWEKKNYWHDKFINEIYLTIGCAAYEKEEFSTIRSIVSTINYQKIEQQITEACNFLNKITTKIKSELSNFSVESLKIYHHGKFLNSNVIEFFNKIITLENKKFDLPIVDLSKYFNNFKRAVGNNIIEVRNENSKFLATIITLKEYHEMDISLLVNILNLPIPFTITQTLNFVDQEYATTSLNEQLKILEISGDKELLAKFNNKDSETNGEKIYCHSQISIMICGENTEQLKHNTANFISRLNSLGFNCFNEDLNLESLFWSQLPGNLHYLKRLSPISLNLFGGFAILKKNIIGQNKDKWGSALTLFRTKENIPYYFNFHYKNRGDCTIIGNNSNSKALFNFIILLAQKYRLNNYIVASQNSIIAKLLNAVAINDNDNLHNSNLHIINDTKTASNQLKKILYNIVSNHTSNKPFILAFEDIDKLLIDEEFGKFFIKLRENVNKKNGIIITKTSGKFNEINDYIKTLLNFENIFITDSHLPTKTINEINHPNVDSKQIKQISALLKEFMLVKPDHTITAELNISGLNKLLPVLQEDNKAKKYFAKYDNLDDIINALYKDNS